MWELVLPLFGFLIGTVAALTGVGGGLFIVPLLTLIYVFAPANAIGTSLTAIIFTALAATLNYSKQKRICYLTGLVLALATVPGALLGAYLTTMIPGRQLGLIFGFFMILIAVRMMVDASLLGRKNGSEEKACLSATEFDVMTLRKKGVMMLGVFLTFFGGLASGLLGIGGGVLVVPIMALIMSFPIHLATATSMFTMIFTSIAGVTEHYFTGHIAFEYALLIASGTVIGAQAGAQISKKISGRNLRRIFGIMVFVISIQMILKYI